MNKQVNNNGVYRTDTGYAWFAQYGACFLVYLADVMASLHWEQEEICWT